MATRALQFLMTVLLTGCVAWASAIFFGPWALAKYLESQTGGGVEVSGLKVAPKLAMTASRVQLRDAGAVIGSLRGVEVDWNLFLGEQPAVLISVANGTLTGSSQFEDLEITLARGENEYPIKISGKAASAGDQDVVAAVDVRFTAFTDYEFKTLRRVTATTGALTFQGAAPATASNTQIEVDQVDLGADLSRQDLSGALALKNVVVGRPDLTTPEADIKFTSADGLIQLEFGARDLISEAAGLAVSGLTGGVEFDAARSRLAGPIDLALDNISWENITLPLAGAKITFGDKEVKVSAEGTTIGTDITLARRYIGRAPDASFSAEFGLLAADGGLRVSGDVNLSASSEPVELDLSFEGAVANAGHPLDCANFACGVSDVLYKYVLSVAGERVSGASRCQESSCSVGGRTHEIATSDTNRFFTNLQGTNLLNPLVLGGAYAQMLQGVQVGAGHKINF